MPALKSAISLRESNFSHPRAASALAKLFKKWLSMSEEEKLAACGKDQRILAVVVSEIVALGCPDSEAGIAAWYEDNRVKSAQSDRPVEHLHEHIKMQMRFFEAQPSADWGA